MADCSENKQITLILTGFGPFMSVAVNPSWLLAQETAKMLKDHPKINLLCCEELEVTYKTVAQRVPELHTIHSPRLAIHIGAAIGFDCIQIETVGQNQSYQIPDVKNCLPDGLCANKAGPNSIQTKIDANALIKYCTPKIMGVPIKASTNAGQYLCDFCFYTSLNCNEFSLFVHIPDIDQPFTLDQMSKTLFYIIEGCAEQLLA